MYFSIRKLLIAFFLTICAVSSYADEDWPVKCYSSFNEFKNLYYDNENVIVTEWGKDLKEKYYVIQDSPAMRGGDILIYHKEINGEMCLIASSYGEGVQPRFSDNGTLLEITVSQYLYPRAKGDLDSSITIYRLGKQGHFFPSECTSTREDGYSIEHDCLTGEEKSSSSPSPPSFDCSNFRKLNLSERFVCTSTDLAKLDSILAKNYKALQAANIGKLHNQLTKDQREWIKQRNECGKNADWDCVDAAYRERIEEICTKYPVISGSAPVCISAPDRPKP